MTIINWAQNVNTKVLRSTDWSDEVAVKGDPTRCGVKKVRAIETFKPNVYNVKMHFTKTEKDLFKAWFDASRKGLYPFYFPDIEGSGTTKVYRFSPESSITYNNVGGKIIEASMTFEEV